MNMKRIGRQHDCREEVQHATTLFHILSTYERWTSGKYFIQLVRYSQQRRVKPLHRFQCTVRHTTRIRARMCLFRVRKDNI